MRAFFEEKLKKNVEAALEFYTSALDHLLWGNERWKDVPFEDKGAVFRDTFIRGIKCLRLDAFIEAYSKHPGENSKFPLGEVLAGADDLLSELEGTIGEEPGPGAEDVSFYLSFFRYPLGHAHAMRGFYYRHTGSLRRKKEGITDELVRYFMNATRAYVQAAEYYPIDDEKHAWYLHVAFNLQFDVGGPVEYLLMILDKLHDSVPRMKPIWEFGADAQSGSHAMLARTLESRKDLMQSVAGKSQQERKEMCARRGP